MVSNILHAKTKENREKDLLVNPVTLFSITPSLLLLIPIFSLPLLSSNLHPVSPFLKLRGSTLSLCLFLLSSWSPQEINALHKYGLALSNSNPYFHCCCLLSPWSCFPSINSCWVFFPMAPSASVLSPLGLPPPRSYPPPFLNFIKLFIPKSHFFTISHLPFLTCKICFIYPFTPQFSFSLLFFQHEKDILTPDLSTLETAIDKIKM